MKSKIKARVHYKNKGLYNEERIIAGLQKRIKRMFGYTPKPHQIKKVWKDYCKMVGEGLSNNEVVNLDKKNKVFVMGERIKEGTTAHLLMKEGKTLSRGKIVKIKNINARHLGIKYKIEYEHTGRIRDDVYFIPHKNLSRTVHNALINTQVNYSIKPCP